MRAVIIGSGEIKDYKKAKSRILAEDYIICADGGYDHAVKMGVNPDILIGDFDSISNIPNDTEKVQYPTRKDMTDSHIAMDKALEKGYDEMLLLGFTGDRADHSLTNILLLINYPNAVIADDNNEIRLITNAAEIDGKAGDTISIIPVCGNLEGITTTGLEYPLDNETLYIGDSRGVSNVMTENICQIKCTGGMGLIIKVDKV